MSITLPTNPSISSASVGKDFILSINVGTADTPIWKMIGGQRGANLNRTADEIDVSHKTSGGWKSVKAGLRSWGIDLDGLVLLQDEGVQALEYAYMNGIEVNVQLKYPDGSSQTGWGSLTDFSMDTPHDGEATLKGTIGGNGPLSDRIPGITPLNAAVSKATAKDTVFTICPANATVSSVKNGSTSLTSGTDYSYTNGALTIKSTYLASASVGTLTLNIVTGDNAKLAVNIMVTA